MARNLKKEYISKVAKMDAPNGYKFDIANYLHNPAYGYDYPSFFKVVAEDEEFKTYRRVLYFKFYNGSGEYQEEIFKISKNDEGWAVAREVKTNVLEKSNRFNIKKLLTFCQ